MQTASWLGLMAHNTHGQQLAVVPPTVHTLLHADMLHWAHFTAATAGCCLLLWVLLFCWLKRFNDASGCW